MKVDIFHIAITSLLLILIPNSIKAIRRPKRSNTENFKVLLSMYKMNPLKHSNVFKTFSNHILLPGPDERRAALNFNINESQESREKESSTNTKFKNEELINHATHKPIERLLRIEEGIPEEFKPGYFLSEYVNEIDFDRKDNDESDIFNEDVFQTSTVRSKQLNVRYTNKIPETNDNFKQLSKVNNKVLYNIKETIVI